MSTRSNLTTNQPSAKPVKGYKGMAMEGFIARWYAQNTRKDVDRFKEVAQQIINTVAKGSAILEVAPGPGYLSIELARRGGYRLTGLDISHTFVEIAQQNAREAGVTIDFRQGDAAYMPFDDAQFDFVVCTAAFKNFTQPVQAIAEMYRILKPGGQVLINDLRRDASQAAINEHVDSMGLNSLNSLLTKLAFRFMLKGNAYTAAEIRAIVAQTGFANCEIKEDLIGMDIWLGK
jgi:ubiquinone/menaquinone biosynthesis C-methylase UbiE